MDHGLHNNFGMVYGWIIGLIAIVVVIWLVVKVMRKKTLQNNR